MLLAIAPRNPLCTGGERQSDPAADSTTAAGSLSFSVRRSVALTGDGPGWQGPGSRRRRPNGTYVDFLAPHRPQAADASRRTQRKPTWVIPVSLIWGRRAAGR